MSTLRNESDMDVYPKIWGLKWQPVGFKQIQSYVPTLDWDWINLIFNLQSLTKRSSWHRSWSSWQSTRPCSQFLSIGEQVPVPLKLWGNLFGNNESSLTFRCSNLPRNLKIASPRKADIYVFDIYKNMGSLPIFPAEDWCSTTLHSGFKDGYAK